MIFLIYNQYDTCMKREIIQDVQELYLPNFFCTIIFQMIPDFNIFYLDNEKTHH